MKFRFSGNLLRYVDFSRDVEVTGETLALLARFDLEALLGAGVI